MNTAISNDGGFSNRLEQLPRAHKVSSRRLTKGPVAVSATLAAPHEEADVHESTITLEYGSVSDYEIHVGVYRPDVKYAPLTALTRALRDVIDRHDLFPNGHYEITPIGRANDPAHDGYIITFEAGVLFSRSRDTRPVKDAYEDIKTLLELRDRLQRE